MALTANVGSQWAAKYGAIETYVVGTNATIYRGAIVALRLTDGLVYPAVNDTSDTYKQWIVGYAMEKQTAGLKIRVRNDGSVRLKFNGTATGTEGKLACVYDDETVQLFTVGSPQNKYICVGRINQIIDVQTVYVNIQNRPARLVTSLYD